MWGGTHQRFRVYYMYINKIKVMQIKAIRTINKAYYNHMMTIHTTIS